MRDASLSAPDAVVAASERLAPFGLTTPLNSARCLVPHAHFKCENLQRTGSFKIRGALNKLLLLTPEQRECGVVTSSTGNHGLAVAEALKLTSGRGTVVVSASASPYKIERLTNAGLDVVVSDGDPMAAELEARALGDREGRVYISPYNDPDVMAGQGSMAVEILEQRPDIKAVFVAGGGGGWIAGIASYLKAVRPDVRLGG